MMTSTLAPTLGEGCAGQQAMDEKAYALIHIYTTCSLDRNISSISIPMSLQLTETARNRQVAGGASSSSMHALACIKEHNPRPEDCLPITSTGTPHLDMYFATRKRES